MKKTHRHTRKAILIALLMITMVSCKDSFLEILPKGRIIATKTTDYDLLLNNLDLINFTNSYNHVLMSDEICAIEPNWTGATYKEKQSFKWEGDLYGGDEDAGETVTAVKNLYIYNKVIDEVLNSTEGTDAMKKSIQAEALAGRAWVNFLLVNFYGKPYNPSTSATDLGFPLITKADINGSNYTRATVQQSYDLIISDLTTAIPNLINAGVPHRIRMSKAAAQGILAKVYIWMGRYSDALPLLNESIGNLPKSTVTTGLVNYNTAFQGFPTIVNDLENVYAKNMGDIYLSTSVRLLWLTPEAAALYNPNDARLSKLFLSTTFPNGVKLYKRMNTTTYNFGLRVPELYLLRAEVKARLNDLTGAAADLLLLRQNRLPAADAVIPAAIAADKLSLLKFTMDERIREFAVTGYRWFDMRRLSVDPLFGNTAFQHKVYNAAGVVSETFTFKPERFMFRFSPKILGENPQIVNNP